jgi:hypothetical protein
VSAKGTISFATATYKAGVWLAGQRVEIVCDGGLVQVFHRGVLIATHVELPEVVCRVGSLVRERPGEGHDPGAHEQGRRSRSSTAGLPARPGEPCGGAREGRSPLSPSRVPSYRRDEDRGGPRDGGAISRSLTTTSATRRLWWSPELVRARHDAHEA